MAQDDPTTSPKKGVQFATAGLLILLVVGLVGGIIWYNFEKTTDLVVGTAEQLLAESSEDTVHRVELFYEPVLAIVALASRVPQISDMTEREREDRLALMITGL